MLCIIAKILCVITKFKNTKRKSDFCFKTSLNFEALAKFLRGFKRRGTVTALPTYAFMEIVKIFFCMFFFSHVNKKLLTSWVSFQKYTYGPNGNEILTLRWNSITKTYWSDVVSIIKIHLWFRAIKFLVSTHCRRIFLELNYSITGRILSITCNTQQLKRLISLHNFLI